MPESAEVRALVEQGCLRITDIAPILGVTKQRVSQIVAEREDFPSPAEMIGRARALRPQESGGATLSNTYGSPEWLMGNQDLWEYGQFRPPALRWEVGACSERGSQKDPCEQRRTLRTLPEVEGVPSQHPNRAQSEESRWKSN